MIYTYDTFLSAAKESENNKSKFIRKYRRLYEYARQIGWYDSYKWNKYADEGKNNYEVYVVMNSKDRVVYVGLTKNHKKREYGHKYSGTVHDYFGNNFKMDILEDNLSAAEAKRLEDYYKNQFKKDGWKVLNKAKTGERSSSLGGSNKELTYDTCYELSLKYKTKTEFQKKEVSAYRKALNSGWLNEWYQNVDTEKWTREACYEEAKKYNTKMEFRRGNQFLYNKARKNKWLKDYVWMTRTNKWNHESCYHAAKNCTSKTDFSNKYPAAYKIATQKGWINNYTWFKNTSELLAERGKKWTYENCRELAKKYNTRWEFGKENSGAYHACLKYHWLDSFDWLTNLREQWTYKKCMLLAKKYKSRWEFGKNNPGAYKAALKNHWINDFFPISHKD